MVKTVPRRGYLFDAEVTRNDRAEGQLLYTDEVEGVSLTIEQEVETEALKPTRALAKRHFRRAPLRSGLLAAVLILVALAAFVIWLSWRNQPKPSLPDIRTLAVFQEDNPTLIEQARKELGVAERIDPKLAEVHLARYFIAFSQYEGWSVDKAMRELRFAQQLDPNVGHAELVDLYSHIGLEEQTAKEFELALTIDPNNQEVKDFYINSCLISGRPDEALEASKKFSKREPDLRYLVEKGMVKEAEPLARLEYQKDPACVEVCLSDPFEGFAR